MELGKRIISLRKEHHMTQEDFAEVCNVTRQTVSNWENGKNYPDLETLVFISDHFDISLDILLKGDRNMVSKITQVQKRDKFNTIAVIVLTALILGALIISNIRVFVSPEDYDIDVVRVEMSDFSEEGKDDYGNAYRVVSIGKTPISDAVTFSVDDEMYRDFHFNDGGYCVIVKSHVGTISWVEDWDDTDTIGVCVQQTLSNKILPSGKKNEVSASHLLTAKDFDAIYDGNIAKDKGIDEAVIWRKAK